MFRYRLHPHVLSMQITGNLSVVELLVVLAAVAAVAIWLATLGIIAVHRDLTPPQRVWWLFGVVVTQVFGAVAFLAWDRMRVRPAPRATLQDER